MAMAILMHPIWRAGKRDQCNNTRVIIRVQDELRIIIKIR